MVRSSHGAWRLLIMYGVALVTLYFCLPARAAHNPASDIDAIRVTSAYTPDRGEIEIYQVSEFLNDGPSKSAKTFTRIEYGATDNLALEFKVPFRFRRPKGAANTEGLGDIELETKYRLFREPDFPVSFAAGVAIGFPTGDEERGLGEGGFKYEPIISIGKTFDDFSIHQDAELELIRETGGSGLEVQASTTSAVAWSPFDELGFVEYPTVLLALDWKFVEDKNTKIVLIPAIGAEINGLPVEVDWNAGIPIGLSGAADDWGVISAFEVEF